MHVCANSSADVQRVSTLYSFSSLASTSATAIEHVLSKSSPLGVVIISLIAQAYRSRARHAATRRTGRDLSSCIASIANWTRMWQYDAVVMGFKVETSSHTTDIAPARTKSVSSVEKTGPPVRRRMFFSSISSSSMLFLSPVKYKCVCLWIMCAVRSSFCFVEPLPSWHRFRPKSIVLSKVDPYMKIPSPRRLIMNIKASAAFILCSGLNTNSTLSKFASAVDTVRLSRPWETAVPVSGIIWNGHKSPMATKVWMLAR